MMKKQIRAIKKNRFVLARQTMSQYSLPLRMVMCGKVENGRFYLTNRRK